MSEIAEGLKRAFEQVIKKANLSKLDLPAHVGSGWDNILFATTIIATARLTTENTLTFSFIMDFNHLFSMIESDIANLKSVPNRYAISVSVKHVNNAFRVFLDVFSYDERIYNNYRLYNSHEIIPWMMCCKRMHIPYDVAKLIALQLVNPVPFSIPDRF